MNNIVPIEDLGIPRTFQNNNILKYLTVLALLNCQTPQPRQTT